MREYIFKGILQYLEKHPSVVVKRLQIQILLLATAKAFKQKGKCILFVKDPLEEYARFTKECMKKQADRKKLYQVSYRLGRRIRRITGLVQPEDLQRLVFFLYRNIGITMTGNIPGEMVVSECFFSKVYCARECRYISAMDAGIIAGICGNGKFAFTERITEGCGECRAYFSPRGSSPGIDLNSKGAVYE